MPSYLGEYEGASSRRPSKLKRAIRSFQNQSYHNKELIIIADGCQNTDNIVLDYFNSDPQIKCYSIKKQPLFSGKVRSEGINMANGEIICYLDSDDFLGSNHLSNFALNFGENDWIYTNDYIFNGSESNLRVVDLEQGSCGTSSVAHKKNINVFWDGCDGYNHDWKFVEKLIQSSDNYCKIYGGEYNVCHIPDLLDH